MARYIGPRCRKCRALGMSVCGKGAKCALLRRQTPPGVHPAPRRISDYKRLLLEKQRLRYLYWLTERQFARYADGAKRLPGVAGKNLLELLEGRLDVIVYRLGWTPTLPAARQLVVHGHVLMNGRPVTSPSYQLAAGDRLSISETGRRIPMVAEAAQNPPALAVPYLSRTKKFEAKLEGRPRAEDIPVEVQTSLIIEYYAR
ncbi:MAG: 30S ribosomal protein S4 [Pseudomonadota bacterium]